MKKSKKLTPQNYFNGIRVVGYILLYFLWSKSNENIIGFFYVCALIILSLVRFRFKNLQHTLIIDQFLNILVAIAYQITPYGILITGIELSWFKKNYYIIPVVGYLIYSHNYSMLAGLIIVCLMGEILRQWYEENQVFYNQIHENNKKRYELQHLRDDLLNANITIAQMAQIQERSRIAREIHDQAGHKIIGAYMSFQAIEDAMSLDDEQVNELFKEALNRLETGIENIREAVHNLAPVVPIGIEVIQRICDDFKIIPITLNIHGNTASIPIYLYYILEPCLKEGLTNVLRHANATYIKVEIDVTPYIIRMSIENDHAKEMERYDGIGLRNLRIRAMAVGGSISMHVDTEHRFQLVCVLPLKGS